MLTDLTFVADTDITFVFQGPWNASLRANVEQTRRVFPSASFIISSTDRRVKNEHYNAEIVISTDPGALPPYKRGTDAPENNVNRQIVSTRAGLARVRTQYAVKIRTDCSMNSRAFVAHYERFVLNLGRMPSRMLASSVYTLHPQGIEGLPFHVSDWFFFGKTSTLREYYDVPLMRVSDACWYDNARHDRNSHFFARQYRSRFSPEQYIAVENARKGDYNVPSHIADAERSVVESYIAFLVDKFFVCDLLRLGLVFEKYQGVLRSNFQFFNCVWESDWLFFARQRAREEMAASSQGVSVFGPPLRQRCFVVAAIRRLDCILGILKIFGLMPLIGDVLGFFRKLNYRGSDLC